MNFNSNGGGIAVRADIRVVAGGSTWNTRLAQLLRGNRKIVICTFSLSPDYVGRLLRKRSRDVVLVVNSKFAGKAMEVKREFPNVRIFLAANTHAKMALVEPDMVWLSSENLVRSRNFENTVGICSRDVYEFYMRQMMLHGLFRYELEG